MQIRDLIEKLERFEPTKTVKIAVPDGCGDFEFEDIAAVEIDGFYLVIKPFD